jgi:hypothetical protein
MSAGRDLTKPFAVGLASGDKTMSDTIVQVNVSGPESVVISKEERYELIAQVARALQERRRAIREEYNMEWEAEDSVIDFTRASLDFN